jgi:hypothetical protein
MAPRRLRHGSNVSTLAAVGMTGTVQWNVERQFGRPKGSNDIQYLKRIEHGEEWRRWTIEAKQGGAWKGIEHHLGVQIGGMLGAEGDGDATMRQGNMRGEHGRYQGQGYTRWARRCRALTLIPAVLWVFAEAVSGIRMTACKKADKVSLDT